jgi:hypothetical protein
VLVSLFLAGHPPERLARRYHCGVDGMRKR